MTNKKVIFFDIDGTLLNEAKELPASTKEAVFKLKEKGHLVAIATGRAPFMYEDLRKELGIDTYISYNGQYVVSQGEIIRAQALNASSLETLTTAALENHHPVVYLNHDSMKANVPEHQYITDSIQSLKIKYMPEHDPLFYQKHDIYQALLFCSEGEEKPYVDHLPDFDFIRWHPVSMDVLPSSGSKAIGINKVIQKLGIEKEHCYAFGDGLNDIEMLQSIENGIAMGNAKDEVKKAANFVTRSVEDDGILYGLQKLGLL